MSDERGLAEEIYDDVCQALAALEERQIKGPVEKLEKVAALARQLRLELERLCWRGQ